ncbi:HAD family hydrolase [Candidatus Woesearchaeota archaeon]|nr:HAD family hydrolase [Candidatus Woesearchaeota archaeon]
MIKNLVFDWSGTLSNDLPFVYATVMKVFDHFGVSRISLDEFRNSYTLPYMDHARKFGITADKETLDNVFNQHFRSSGFPQPLPKVEEVLQQLKSAGKRMVVLSSHRQEFLDEEAARFFNGNHGSYFERLFGGVHNKEEAILPVIKAVDFTPSETIIVGDTEHDIRAGHKVGLFTAAVLSGYRPKEKLVTAKPHFIVNDVQELLKLGIF